MLHTILRGLGAALPLCALLIAASQADAWQTKILPEHFGRYNLPPSRFGWPLDDYSAGYYGGGRYREYYSQGRGFGIANFPPPVPNDPWTNWVPRGIPLHHPKPTTFHPGPALPVGPPSVCRIILDVPEGAEVWLEGQKMTQTGGQRTFVSPPLAQGQPYHYEVRVRWLEQGQEKSELRTVGVQAGQAVTARFPEVDRTQPAALPLLQPVSGQ